MNFSFFIPLATALEAPKTGNSVPDSTNKFAKRDYFQFFCNFLPKYLHRVENVLNFAAQKQKS